MLYKTPPEDIRPEKPEHHKYSLLLPLLYRDKELVIVLAIVIGSFAIAWWAN